MVRGDRCMVKCGRYFLGPPALHEVFGDNGLGVSPFYLGGSSFLSISAQPELIERDLVGLLLAPTSQGIIFKGSSLEFVLCMARIYFLAASLKLHGLNE